MKVIAELSKQIHEELGDSRKYIECALKKRDVDRDLADLYYNLSNEEMGHMEKLHGAAIKQIQKFKESGKEVPPVMQGIWDWQHEQIIEEAAEVKMLIGMYRH